MDRDVKGQTLSTEEEFQQSKYRKTVKNSERQYLE
jgi:hypothetical protein